MCIYKPKIYSFENVCSCRRGLKSLKINQTSIYWCNYVNVFKWEWIIEFDIFE